MVRLSPFWWLLLSYSGLHVAVRLGVSPGVSWDEAELLLDSQRLQLGYGAQPPLYIWVQQLVFAVTGPSIAALAVVKNLWLASSLVAIYLTARALLLQPALAPFTAFSLLLLPQIAFESHRDLSHTVATTSLACWTFWGLVMLQRDPRWWRYGVLGIVIGAGLLAKYNFALLALALGLALLTTPSWRGLLWRPGALLTLMLAAVISLPHYLWALAHWQRVTAPTVDKFQLADGSWWLSWGTGFANLALALLLLLGLLLIAFGGLLGRGQRPAAGVGGDFTRLLERFWLWLLVGLGALILIAQVTYFKDRWLQPFLAPLVLYLWLRLQPAPLARARWRYGATIAAVVGVSVALLVLPVWVTELRGKPTRLNTPLPAIAHQLQAQGVKAGDLIIASDLHLAGGLRLGLPQAAVTTPANPIRPRWPQAAAPSAALWLVWRGGEAGPVPNEVKRVALGYLGAEAAVSWQGEACLSQQVRLAARYRYAPHHWLSVLTLRLEEGKGCSAAAASR